MKARWKKATLGDVSIVGAGNSAPQDKRLFEGGTFPFIRTSDVGKIRVGELYAAQDHLNEAGIKKLKLHRAGTILIPKSGASTFLDHRVIMCVDAYVSSHLATLWPKEGVIDGRYLFWVSQQIVASGVASDTSYPTLSLEQIKGIEIPLPPIEEQLRIVAELDEAFAAIATATANAEKNLANARLFGRLALERLLTKHAGGLDEVEISEVADIESGVGFPDRFQGKKNEAIPFFKVGDMNTPGNETTMISANNTISEVTRIQLRARIFPIGSVIFPKVGGAIATDKKRLVGVPCCVDNNVMGIIPKMEHLDATLLHQLLLNKPLTEFSNDAGLPSIRKTTVAAWRVRIPKDLAAQRLLADRLTNVASETRKLVDVNSQRLRLLDEIKKSLLHRAFTGELNVAMPETIAA